VEDDTIELMYDEQYSASSGRVQISGVMDDPRLE
jgi:hypothetical protein